jgi:hypothetical protein
MTTLAGNRVAGRGAVFLASIGIVLLSLGSAGQASAEPGAVSVREFVELRSLLIEDAPPLPFTVESSFLSLLQDQGQEWGWGTAGEEETGATESEEYEEKKPEKREETSDVRDVDWREGETPGPGGDFGRAEKGEIWAKKFRIGVEGGGFLPFGAEESFEGGGTGGVFAGFGLPTLIDGVTITSEVRALFAATESPDQDTGFDVSSMIFMFKKDFLFHFFPTNRAFDLYFFVGLGVGYERTEAEPGSAGSGLEDESNAGMWFLADGGFGAWINLGGPVDLVLKLEFNLIPVTDNVPFFAVGEGGFQVKF